MQGHKDAYARKVLWGLLDAAACCDASRCLAKRHLEEGEKRRRAELEALQQDRARLAEREAAAREEREAAAKEKARHAKEVETVDLFLFFLQPTAAAAVVLRPSISSICPAPAQSGELSSDILTRNSSRLRTPLMHSETAQRTMDRLGCRMRLVFARSVPSTPEPEAALGNRPREWQCNNIVARGCVVSGPLRVRLLPATLSCISRFLGHAHLETLECTRLLSPAVWFPTVTGVSLFVQPLTALTVVQAAKAKMALQSSVLEKAVAEARVLAERARADSAKEEQPRARPSSSRSPDRGHGSDRQHRDGLTLRRQDARQPSDSKRQRTHGAEAGTAPALPTPPPAPHGAAAADLVGQPGRHGARAADAVAAASAARAASAAQTATGGAPAAELPAMAAKRRGAPASGSGAEVGRRKRQRPPDDTTPGSSDSSQSLPRRDSSPASSPDPTEEECGANSSPAGSSESGSEADHSEASEKTGSESGHAGSEHAESPSSDEEEGSHEEDGSDFQPGSARAAQPRQQALKKAPAASTATAEGGRAGRGRGRGRPAKGPKAKGLKAKAGAARGAVRKQRLPVALRRPAPHPGRQGSPHSDGGAAAAAAEAPSDVPPADPPIAAAPQPEAPPLDYVSSEEEESLDGQVHFAWLDSASRRDWT